MNWKTVRLNEICETQYGYTASAQDAVVGPKFLRITDITKPLIEWDSVPWFLAALADVCEVLLPFLDALGDGAGMPAALNAARRAFKADVNAFEKAVSAQGREDAALGQAVDRLAPMAEASRDLVKRADVLYKLVARLIETCERECPSSGARNNIVLARRAIDDARERAVEQLEQVGYFWRHARWLTERFPDAELRDVEGLVKLVDRAEIEANDWSLTPGRYVGVAPEKEDGDFDFAEALREIHVELEDLNAEAVTLAAKIEKNFEELL